MEVLCVGNFMHDGIHKKVPLINQFERFNVPAKLNKSGQSAWFVKGVENAGAKV